ncbi:hypothetical protein SD427_07245 [Chryseobacterium sp. JJR-5R]|uniref:hypothetical protein n=1 Tax=Chryseobacterium sp. JJR-5R TaxID=3093923 RepID=UPI002A75BBAB|nr:hypothetical protein [Chryseobacterium sp. JJR-5R]WPO84122.1 hypothetical protein SD427_07245 [Chryseobacterium sp. JJR-5R]
MKYYYIYLTLMLCSLLFLNCNKTKVAERKFNDYEFNTLISGQGSFNIGHAFTIDKNVYVEDDFDFIYYTKNIEERKFLIPGSFGNDNFPVYWREVNLPFRITKKVKGDTLILTKNKRRFIFKRVKNSDF